MGTVRITRSDTRRRRSHAREKKLAQPLFARSHRRGAEVHRGARLGLEATETRCRTDGAHDVGREVGHGPRVRQEFQQLGPVLATDASTELP
jgi:hypothetical protein